MRQASRYPKEVLKIMIVLFLVAFSIMSSKMHLEKQHSSVDTVLYEG